MAVTLNGTTGLVFNDGSSQNTAATGFGFKNRIINGAMVIDQRNAGAAVSTGTNFYSIDRWNVLTATSAKITVQQNAGAVTPPAGFTKYLGITVGASANVTLSATDQYVLRQGIEGFNMADLAWGTASAASITISFWVRSSLTGTFGGTISGSANYSYPFSFSISLANTWEQKTVTIAGQTAGTWNTDNTYFGWVGFDLGVGSTYSGTAGAWANTYYAGVTGAVKMVQTNSATFYITGVQLEKGSTATSFDYRPYGTELQLCQRYYENVTYGSGGAITTGQAISTSRVLANLFWTVIKRATPTMATTGTIYVWNASAAGFAPSSFVFASISVNSGRIDCDGVSTSPLVAGYASMLYPHTEVVLQVSAEL
jgi:hypothetical protein